MYESTGKRSAGECKTLNKPRKVRVMSTGTVEDVCTSMMNGSQDYFVESGHAIPKEKGVFTIADDAEQLTSRAVAKAMHEYECKEVC